MKIELIHDKACPNVAETRVQLRRALEDCGLPATWTEWDRADEQSPPHARRYGSPTVLVNGRDVAGAEPSDGADCCRLYAGAGTGGAGGSYRGAPSVGMIASALRGGWREGGRTGRLRAALAMIPAIVIASLPKLACPACWPAYAGVLSALGLGFLLHEAYLLPLTIAFLLLALTALAIGARRRRGFGPLVAGIVASAVVLTGKFMMNADWAMFTGISLLVAASLWNAWPARATRPTKCCECPSDDGSTDSTS